MAGGEPAISLKSRFHRYAAVVNISPDPSRASEVLPGTVVYRRRSVACWQDDGRCVLVKTLLLIPVFNELRHLPGLVGRLPASADVLFVDDGSGDGSAGFLEDWAAGRPGAEVLRLPENRGKSAALVAGLRRVVARLEAGELHPEDVLVLLDGDGQHPPEVVCELAEQMRRRSLDMLVAHRDFSLYPLWKILGNRLLTWQARLLTGVRWRDTQCGMRGLPVGRAAEAASVMGGQRYCCEQELCVALPRRGWRVANDFPIRTQHYRSNSTLWDALLILLAAFRAWCRNPGAARASAPFRSR